MTGGYAVLEDRGVLAISGQEARPFLQGLISNDIEKARDDNAIFAALLTPQGKYLFDFLIIRHGDRLLLETEAARLPALLQRLTMYKLRAKVDIADVSGDFDVVALPGEGGIAAFGLPDRVGAAMQFEGGVAFIDPRLSALGARALLPSGSVEALLEGKGLSQTEAASYRAFRLGLGVPEGSDDLAVDKATLLESGFEELNGVDFKKGCFVGQELTARMKYRGLVKKRLLPLTSSTPLPASGSLVLAGEREIGELRSVAEGIGLALMRLDRLADVQADGGELTADGVTVTPVKPDWVNF